MKTETILTYLAALSEHNNREWYHAHKAQYQQANAEFEDLIQQLIWKLGETDSSILGHQPKDLTFKLVRDTRFSHDKSPYLPAFRAHIAAKGKLPIPVGYYLMIRPGNQSFLGGGLFADMFKDATAMVRDAIADQPDMWEKVIRSPDFQEHFQLGGTKLKNVPKGFDKDHPQAESLKNKSWYLEYPVSDSTVQDADGFLTLAADIFRRMKPLNDFLNQALVHFQIPERP